MLRAALSRLSHLQQQQHHLASQLAEKEREREKQHSSLGTSLSPSPPPPSLQSEPKALPSEPIYFGAGEKGGEEGKEMCHAFLPFNETLRPSSFLSFSCVEKKWRWFFNEEAIKSKFCGRGKGEERDFFWCCFCVGCVCVCFSFPKKIASGKGGGEEWASVINRTNLINVSVNTF